MYLTVEDFVVMVVKSVILSFIVTGLILLVGFDYHLGVAFCNIMHIPEDFSLSMLGLGMALNVTVLLTVIELIVSYYIVKNLRKIRLFDKFCCFISI